MNACQGRGSDIDNRKAKDRLKKPSVLTEKVCTAHTQLLSLAYKRSRGPRPEVSHVKLWGRTVQRNILENSVLKI